MPIINRTFNINVTSDKLSGYYITADFVQNDIVLPLTVNQSGTTVTVTSNGNIGKVGNYEIRLNFNSINYCL